MVLPAPLGPRSANLALADREADAAQHLVPAVALAQVLDGDGGHSSSSRDAARGELRRGAAVDRGDDLPAVGLVPDDRRPSRRARRRRRERRPRSRPARGARPCSALDADRRRDRRPPSRARGAAGSRCTASGLDLLAHEAPAELARLLRAVRRQGAEVVRLARRGLGVTDDEETHLARVLTHAANRWCTFRRAAAQRPKGVFLMGKSLAHARDRGRGRRRPCSSSWRGVFADDRITASVECSAQSAGSGSGSACSSMIVIAVVWFVRARRRPAAAEDRRVRRRPPRACNDRRRMALTLRYVVADVFTDTPLTGNQLAVFTDGREVDDATMQDARARDEPLGDACSCFRPRRAGTRGSASSRRSPSCRSRGIRRSARRSCSRSRCSSTEIRLETGAGIVPVRARARRRRGSRSAG